MINLTHQIVSLLATDASRAFQLMYEHYYEQLCRFVLKFVDSADETEDIVQNMFVQLWHKQEHLQKTENLRAYLFQSARFASLNYLRSKREEKSLSDLDVELLDLANDPEQASEEKFDSVKKVIETLPPQSKRIFELNRLEGYSYKEIADQLNISHRTVDSHLSSAMKTLRKKLNPELVSGALVVCLCVSAMHQISGENQLVSVPQLLTQVLSASIF